MHLHKTQLIINKKSVNRITVQLSVCEIESKSIDEN